MQTTESIINKTRLLERFLQYVQIDTTAVDDTDNYPSSAGQLELGKLLVQHLKEIGIENATQDEHGIVMATVESNMDTDVPVVAFNAHVDTSPETTGSNVQPNVIENYDGGDILLTGDPTKQITQDSNPELAGLIGKTIITTDGTTLLGGDDKCGVAIIMEIASFLVENPDVKHGPVRLLFTCDEEIGRGVLHVAVAKVDATVCYTFDGGEHDQVDIETFSADMATITVSGVNIHPAIAKDKMVNAVRIAGAFLERMPKDLSPEKTEGRDGFMHPYLIEGGVAETTIKIILRSFETEQLKTYATQLKTLADDVQQQFAGSQIDVAVREQYRNLADGLAVEPRGVEYAIERISGLVANRNKASFAAAPTVQFLRRGLPTPNLSSGQHNLHSPLEFACLDEMVAAGEIGVEILKLWAEKSSQG